MRWIAILFLTIMSGCVGVSKEGIVKVLPHYLDEEGRHSDGPSLLHRDIYQKKLREEPSLINALRFDIKWRGGGLEAETAKLRVEVRSSKAGVPQQVFEQKIKPVGSANWTGVLVSAEEYRKIGKMESWRATLLVGDKVLAEQKSFLW
jgi:hypothetical protein|tara:strand:- start:409 stop:852 length:444 start_codon:yes stop_codon:yes gene_type:complete